MIHHTPEGHHIKLGLNFKRSRGGFCLLWAWYDFAKHEATTYRFRFRMHLRPYIIRSVEKFNVIEDYLRVRDLELVHREVLQDLNATEADAMSTNEPFAYIKPV